MPNIGISHKEHSEEIKRRRKSKVRVVLETSNLEQAVLNGVLQKDIDHELEYLHKNYDDTLDMDAFKTQISYLSARMGESATKSTTFMDIVSFVREMPEASRSIMSSVVTMLKLILVQPSTNASSGKLFAV